MKARLVLSKVQTDEILRPESYLTNSDNITVAPMKFLIIKVLFSVHGDPGQPEFGDFAQERARI